MDDSNLTALVREAYVNLATFRRNGNAVETPVWFAIYDGRLYVFTAEDAGKVKRLRNNPKVRVAACGVRGGIKGHWIEGSARRTDDPDTVASAYDALLRKYGWQMRLTNALSRLSGRIHQRAILEIDLQKAC